MFYGVFFSAIANFNLALSCKGFAITLALSSGLFRESETIPVIVLSWEKENSENKRNKIYFFKFLIKYFNFFYIK